MSTTLQEYAPSETHTAPLPKSTSDISSPLRGSRSLAPFSVDNAIQLPLPITDAAPTRQLDSARDMHLSPEVPAAPTAHREPSAVPPLNADMSLSQLAERVEDTVTPVTSARYGEPVDRPEKVPDIPPPTPQFSAASLVQGEESKSSTHTGSPEGDAVPAALSKRHPDWPADGPTNKVQLYPVLRPADLCLVCSFFSFIIPTLRCISPVIVNVAVAAMH
jgi:hypothetical protein